MLGSAISKRWVVSLALVGLVSLFMASYEAVWSGSASATTTTTTTTVASTPTPVPPTAIPTDTTLASITPFDSGITLAPASNFGGNVRAFNASSVDITNTAPGLTYAWSVTNGCATFSTPTSSVLTLTSVNTGCSGVVTITVKQFGGNTQVGTFNLIVNSPVVPVVIVPVTNASSPATLPTGVDSSKVTEIKAGDGGALAIDTENGQSISLNVAGGSLDSGEAASVSIETISTGSVLSAPPAASEGASSGTFKFGSSIVQITWYDKDGGALDTKKLNKPAEVCMTYTQADVDGSHGGRDGLGIWRHNGTDWVTLNSTAYTNPNRVCAFTTSFSPFALGLEVAPPDAPAAGATGLPATGDYTLGVNGLLLALFAGFALVGTGVFTARRARRVRENS